MAKNIQEPGAIRAPNMNVLIHTKSAIHLINGRKADPKKKKPEIVGLNKFASIMRLIQVCAQKDDPYADFYLIKIDNLIKEYEEYISGANKEVQELLESREGFNVNDISSEAPVKFEPKYVSSYSYRVLFLVQELDKYLTKLHMTRHFGLMATSDSYKKGDNAMGKMRSLLHKSFLGWKNFSITREDYQKGNQRVEQAKEHFGFELPEEIVSGEKRSEFAPAIKASVEKVNAAA